MFTVFDFFAIYFSPIGCIIQLILFIGCPIAAAAMPQKETKPVERTRIHYEFK